MRYALMLMFILIANVASADFLVYFDKDTKEVKRVVEQARAVKLSDADKEALDFKKLPGSIKDYDLDKSYTDYKLVGNNFVVNTKKISDRLRVEIDSKEALDKKLADRESAKQKLMSDPVQPLTEAEFNAIIE